MYSWCVHHVTRKDDGLAGPAFSGQGVRFVGFNWYELESLDFPWILESIMRFCLRVEIFQSCRWEAGHDVKWGWDV